MKREKLKAAIVGYGNIGRYAVEAIMASPDFELTAIVRRSNDNVPYELARFNVIDSVSKLNNTVDVALLCVPTRKVEEYASEVLKMGINTVDSFDTHNKIVDLRRNLNQIAVEHNAVSVISAGWDPGIDSLVRMIMQFSAPQGITYTNFGPGMSMGHTVVAKSIEGVNQALSMTIPMGTGVHRRMVYVELQDGADFNSVEKSIKSDDYFASDETHVIATNNIKALMNSAHGVNISRNGVSGMTANQSFEFNMKITNPALTAQIMLASARASLRQKAGAYTMAEIPPIDFLYGDREELIASLV